MNLLQFCNLLKLVPTNIVPLGIYKGSSMLDASEMGRGSDRASDRRMANGFCAG